MTPEAFWDRHAPKYAAKPIADPDAYEAMLTRVRTFLKPSDHVLEIGCGTGGTALALAPGVAQIIGADVSAEMVRIARRKTAAGDADNVVFEKAAATEEVPNAPFDAVLAFSLLHLVGDLPAVLERAHSQLKPGGLFISKTVCMKDRAFWARAVVRTLMRLGIAPHLAMLSREDLIRALSRAGFDLEHSAYFDKNRVNPFLVARRRR